MIRLATVLGAALLVLVLSSQARADEWDDFEQARSAYASQDYALAAERLEALIGGDVPAMQNETLLLESRKYLGAAYLFLGRRADAEHQFALLLHQDASYQIDPIQFPQAVLQVFDEVRVRVERELEAEARQAEAAERAQRERELRLLLENETRIRELEAMAGQETVRTVNSRALALLPFGVGQFRNGNRGLGRALAGTESVLLVLGVGTFLAQQKLPDWDPYLADERISDRLRRANRALNYTNWIAGSAFGALAIIGIIEAQINFRPVVVTTRARELPAEVGRDGDGDEAGEVADTPPRPDLAATGPKLFLGAGVGGGYLRLAF
jgi:hypothetical protein